MHVDVQACPNCSGLGPKYDLDNSWCARCVANVLAEQKRDERAVVKHEVITT